jgi:hypothetical protein
MSHPSCESACESQHPLVDHTYAADKIAAMLQDKPSVTARHDADSKTHGLLWRPGDSVKTTEPGFSP